jgi:hypothetical protein
MADIVIREVATGVWTFSWYVLYNSCEIRGPTRVASGSPFALFGWIHIGGRSTAIKLSSGGVWVTASTPLSPETKAKLDELGPVK